MGSVDETPTFAALLEHNIRAAGGVNPLAAAAGVRAATLRQWRRGGVPTQRVSRQVEQVDDWARDHMNGSYPPPGYPANGLSGFILGPAPSTRSPKPPADIVGSVPASWLAPADPVTTDPEAAPPVTRWRRLLPWLVAAVLVSAVAAAALLIPATDRPALDPINPPPGPTATIVVQNMYATGPSTLAEDRTPSYLSTRAIPRCAESGCKVAGSELGTGDILIADCTIQAEQPMTNANIDSPGIRTNPGAVISSLWYHASRSDGLSGLISEVYIAPRYRGGLGLPVC